MYPRVFETAVMDSDASQDVFDIRLRVLDHYIEVAIFVEHACVDQLELAIVLATPAVFVKQLIVREGCLWVLIQKLHIRVCRRAVEVVVSLLHVLAVVTLASHVAEHTLLEDRVETVPECDREADLLVAIADTGNAVLVPAVRL